MSQNQEIIESKLCAYIDGELDSEGKAEIEKHLEVNPQHRRLLESLRATRDLIRWLPREPAPSEVAETLSGQLERSVLLNYEGDSLRVSPWPRIMAAAAIVLLTAGLGVAVYYALPKSQKPAQLALHSQISDNTGDIVPAPPMPEGRSDLAAASEPDHSVESESDKMRVATPEDLRKDGGGTDSKLSDATQQQNTANASNARRELSDLDQLAEQVGQNPEAFLSSVASNNAQSRNAAPADSNSAPVVLLVRSNTPEQTEKQLTSYFNQQQIQWRQPAASQQNRFVVQSQQRVWALGNDAAKKQELEKANAADEAPVAAPPLANSVVPATQPSQNQALAASQSSGLSQQAAIAPTLNNSISSNAVFVCQMSRRQAEQLSTTISNEAAPGAQVENLNGLNYGNSVEQGPTQNGSLAEQTPSQAAGQGGLASGQIGRERMVRAQPQTEPAQVLQETVEAKASGVASTTQPAASSPPALNSPALVPATQPSDLSIAIDRARPATSQPTTGPAAATAATSPSDAPVNVVIMVQPNAPSSPSTTASAPSTQPSEGAFPQKAQAIPAPVPEPAVK